ncbi:monooxygenase [Glonium stellatum]|uniref:Monooxygenase n=1 Tax=Glonium stellatum TaxID=574774 RepID=A0A8E2F953_9PEZI|nr:monooxygenase [Glonium stellatum]
MGSITKAPTYDAIIVGSGFGGCYILQKLRNEGFKCLVIDEAPELGGVWYWNCYAGARTDSKVPLYEFSDEKVWKDWLWTEKYPSWREIQKYFEHVESKLHLKKDIQFNSCVVAATFEDDASQWRVKTHDGVERTARNFIICTGFASKAYIPAFKGLNTFAGISCHTSRWPHEDIDFHGKKVGIVGNGSSGLQVIQEVAPIVKHLTVFQRSPTYALPMRQRKLDKTDQDKSKYSDLFELRKTTFAGIEREFNPKCAADVSPEERQEFFEELWEEGDIIMNKESNQHAYEFWRSKVLPRIKDPKKAEILAPKKKPYFFSTKRATLEQRYYEVYNQDNVESVDAKANPIKEVVPNGVITGDGKLHELDILILATGFDSVTGGILAIDIHGSNGQSLKSKWEKGTWTNMGLTTAGFPNIFFLYGPQGPTSFCNGPTCAEIQGNWIADVMDYLKKNGFKQLDSTAEAEAEWRQLTNGIGDTTLLPFTASEYMGTNIPGKPKEMLNYLGGLPDYVKRITSAVDLGFPGFTLQ